MLDRIAPKNSKNGKGRFWASQIAHGSQSNRTMIRAGKTAMVDNGSGIKIKPL